MNKNDTILIVFIGITALMMLALISFFKISGDKTAKVYYQNELVLTIPLEQNKKEIYTINGYNGEVKIEVENERLRVIEEKSPLHLCSKQGWIKESYETIVCLPNKVVIEIEASNNLDAVVK